MLCRIQLLLVKVMKFSQMWYPNGHHLNGVSLFYDQHGAYWTFGGGVCVGTPKKYALCFKITQSINVYFSFFVMSMCDVTTCTSIFCFFYYLY